ncbi:hypothetical protein B0H11DRAFT_640945 [Mycena galericulata]|nr:hypothetical protein B0H11DRAFT_640945 [Mycena galericulata]
MLSGVASLLSLPPEICAAICEEVDLGTLSALCRISLIFRDQAQRILYHTVDLQDCNMRLVKSWCLAVTRHSALAKRVYSLSLQLPNSLEPTDAGKISRALALCINIKHLNMLHDPDFPPDRCVYHWIIEQCAFRLEQFSSSYFCFLSEGEVFFDNQPDLRLLSLPSTPYNFFSEAQLPNLIAIDAPLYLVASLPGERPLERIQIHCERSDFTIGLSSLSRYASTLKTLTVVRDGVEWGSSTVDMVHEIAQALPALTHFGINEHEKLHSFFSMEESPSRGLEQFTCLETFTFRIRRGICFWVTATEKAYNVGSRAELGEFGLSMLEGCPTLRQIVVGGEATPNTESKCTLTRSPDGAIRREDGSELDFDAVATFWN